MARKANMLEFVRKAFKSFFELFLWLMLVACAIFGGLVGYNINPAATIIALPIGLVVGFILVIMVGGLTATFLSVAENLKKIEENTRK